jgi:hypothetical protein
MTGFRVGAAYGFELVDATAGDFSAKTAINRKFTPNQIRRIFGKIYAN